MSYLSSWFFITRSAFTKATSVSELGQLRSGEKTGEMESNFTFSYVVSYMHVEKGRKEREKWVEKGVRGAEEMELGLQEAQFPPFLFTCPFSHTICIFASVSFVAFLEFSTLSFGKKKKRKLLSKSLFLIHVYFKCPHKYTSFVKGPDIIFPC